VGRARWALGAGPGRACRQQQQQQQQQPPPATASGSTMDSRPIVAHEVLEFVAFGICLPLGIAVARWYGIRGLDWEGSTVIHALLAVAALVFASFGCSTSLIRKATFTLHGVVGVSLMALMGIQVVVGLFYLHPRVRIWEEEVRAGLSIGDQKRFQKGVPIFASSPAATFCASSRAALTQWRLPIQEGSEIQKKVISHSS
jgi:hypothetical protein